ncbi:MAG: phasin [Xanthobacteraceae bacterium]
MVEATTIKQKAKPAGSLGAAFEGKLDSPRLDSPHFDVPKFDIPKIEVPAAFREFAEKGVSQAKESYEKMKTAAEEATDVMETTYATASKGATEYGLKLIEAARINTNAALDFAAELMSVKSFSEMIELSTGHARKQFETLSEQTKTFTALAQKVATETSEPIKSGVSKVFNKVA